MVKEGEGEEGEEREKRATTLRPLQYVTKMLARTIYQMLEFYHLTLIFKSEFLHRRGIDLTNPKLALILFHRDLIILVQ